MGRRNSRHFFWYWISFLRRRWTERCRGIDEELDLPSLICTIKDSCGLIPTPIPVLDQSRAWSRALGKLRRARNIQSFDCIRQMQQCHECRDVQEWGWNHRIYEIQVHSGHVELRVVHLGRVHQIETSHEEVEDALVPHRPVHAHGLRHVPRSNLSTPWRSLNGYFKHEFRGWGRILSVALA